jgi:hypothetical protein
MPRIVDLPMIPKWRKGEIFHPKPQTPKTPLQFYERVINMKISKYKKWKIRRLNIER